MITTYEQELISRLTYEEIKKWLFANDYIAQTMQLSSQVKSKEVKEFLGHSGLF